MPIGECLSGRAVVRRGRRSSTSNPAPFAKARRVRHQWDSCSASREARCGGLCALFGSKENKRIEGAPPARGTRFRPSRSDQAISRNAAEGTQNPGGRLWAKALGYIYAPQTPCPKCRRIGGVKASRPVPSNRSVAGSGVDTGVACPEMMSREVNPNSVSSLV